MVVPIIQSIVVLIIVELSNAEIKASLIKLYRSCKIYITNLIMENVQTKNENISKYLRI